MSFKLLAVCLSASLLLSSCAARPTISATTGLSQIRGTANRAGMSVQTLSLTAARQPADVQAEISSDIDDDFVQVLNTCQPVFTGYEHEAQSYRWISFGIAMVGTIAGSIVVPALSAATNVDKTAVAAVGGLSGAANSAQNVLNSQNLTAASELQIRSSIQQQFSAALNDYYAARSKNDANGAIVALEKAHASCVAYATQTGSADIVK